MKYTAKKILEISHDEKSVDPNKARIDDFMTSFWKRRSYSPYNGYPITTAHDAALHMSRVLNGGK